MNDNPWLQIDADEYEAHMRAVGQDQALRDIFARVVAQLRPARVAVLGCTTGADLAQLDPAITKLAVGLDVNPAYLDIAAGRLGLLGDRAHLVCGDVAVAELPPGPYDLVHAALLLEYVPPERLFTRAHEWLAAAGMLSLVTQEPVVGQPPVSDTGVESVRALAPHMTLRTAGQVESLAEEAGFGVAARRTVKVPSGKRLTSFLFDKIRRSLGRYRGSTRC